jgi:hypothetical protein
LCRRLVDGNDVFMESKSGTYSAATYSTQRWHQNRFQWQSGQLVKVWTFDSDWVAPGSQNDFWEPVYHAVLANGFVYDPGAGGTIFKLDRATGAVVARINPFDAVDANTYTASPLSTDGAGNVYYNVVRITGGSLATSFYAHDVVNSWLVKVAPENIADHSERPSTWRRPSRPTAPSTQGGTLRDKIFQQLALGAAYTPASLGGDGKVYSQNAGHLFIAGQ